MHSFDCHFSLLFLLLFPVVIEAYKVLIFSQTFTRSHVLLNARVAQTLAADGHNVTIVEVEYIEPLSNFSGSVAKGVRKISISGKHMEAGKEQWAQLLHETLKPWTAWKMISDAWSEQNKKLQRVFNGACEKFVDANADLLEALKSDHFELFIGGQINFCGSALSQLLGIPVHLLLVSCPLQEHVASLFGLHSPSSYVPSIYGVAYTDKMTLFQRFVNLVAQNIYENAFLYGMDDLTTKFRRKFGDRLRSVREIVRESPLVLVNVDEFTDFPRPLFPNFVSVGGLEFEGSSELKSLQEPYKSELLKGRKGVVFFSMGSAVKTDLLPAPFMQNVLGAFAELSDWHFIVKIEQDDELSRKMAEHSPNILLKSWAPQPAILSHPRLRLFVTHGGYNSLLEGAQSGTPVLSLGFFADQRRNALVAQRNGWGRAFENWKLLEGMDEFRETVRAMLEEDSERLSKAAERVKGILATKPFSARDKLTRYIRFLEQNGGKLPELMPEARNLTAIELYGVDLVLMTVAVLLALIAFGSALLWKLCHCLKREKQKDE